MRLMPDGAYSVGVKIGAACRPIFAQFLLNTIGGQFKTTGFN